MEEQENDQVLVEVTLGVINHAGRSYSHGERLKMDRATALRRAAKGNESVRIVDDPPPEPLAAAPAGPRTLAGRAAVAGVTAPVQGGTVTHPKPAVRPAAAREASGVELEPRPAPAANVEFLAGCPEAGRVHEAAHDTPPIPTSPPCSPPSEGGHDTPPIPPVKGGRGPGRPRNTTETPLTQRQRDVIVAGIAAGKSLDQAIRRAKVGRSRVQAEINRDPAFARALGCRAQEAGE